MDKIALMNKARAKYREEHETQFKKRAEMLFEKHKKEPLFIAGVMLYWAEGKTALSETCNLELNNSDPALLETYCNFL